MVNTVFRILRALLIGLAALLALAPPVDGQTGYGYNSLEWMVTQSDVIVVASVANVQSEPLNPNVASPGKRLTATLQVSETLKGKSASSLQLGFNTLYGQGRNIEEMQSSRGKQLWFLVENPDRGKKAGDASLSFPGADTRFPLSPFPATGWESVTLGAFHPQPNLPRPNFDPANPPWFRMNLDVLESGDQVLNAVREELRAGSNESPAQAYIRLPVELVSWIGQPGSGLDVLILPLDGRLETLAREWILHPDQVLAKRGEGYYKRESERASAAKWQESLATARAGEERNKVEDNRRRTEESLRDTLRREGIRALSNFKSGENIQHLMPLLQDQTSVRSNRDGKTFTEVYLTRREAYSVLKKWGVNVPEPIAEAPAK